MMPNHDLTRLSAVSVATPAADECAAFLADVLEFDVRAGGDGVHHVTAEGDYGSAPPRRMLSLHPGGSDQLTVSALTFDLAGGAAAERLGDRLEAEGVNLEVLPDDGHGGQGIRFSDPLGIEVTCRRPVERLNERLAPSAIRPRRLGHVNLKVPDAERAAAFYTTVLGLRLSERVGTLLWFLRASSDHHNMGLRGGAEVAGIHHVAFEVPGWDSFRVICDHLADLGHRVEYGPGRHSPGHNLFVYFVEPASGLRLELFADMAHIADDETFEPVVWSERDRSMTVNRWGPAPPQSFLE